jgi:hypothetical protein
VFAQSTAEFTLSLVPSPADMDDPVPAFHREDIIEKALAEVCAAAQAAANNRPTAVVQPTWQAQAPVRSSDTLVAAGASGAWTSGVPSSGA